MSKEVRKAQADSRGQEQRAAFENATFLVIGVGGLGCQVLKTLGKVGAKNIHIVDLDVIELSNLNRQILYDEEDVWKGDTAKAEAAAAKLRRLYPDLKVFAHTADVLDLSANFFKKFHCVISALDNVQSRRHVNLQVCLVARSRSSTSSALPVLVDGGTEGWLGHVRSVIPGVFACLECTLSLFPPASSSNIPMCTLRGRPTAPLHCVEFALVTLRPTWPELHGRDLDLTIAFDRESVWMQAMEHGAKHGVECSGLTPEGCAELINRIVPALACVNQVVGNLMVAQAVNILTGRCPVRANYIFFNMQDGNSTTNLLLERDPACPVCSSDHSRPLKPAVDPFDANFDTDPVNHDYADHCNTPQ